MKRITAKERKIKNRVTIVTGLVSLLALILLIMCCIRGDSKNEESN